MGYVDRSADCRVKARCSPAAGIWPAAKLRRGKFDIIQSSIGDEKTMIRKCTTLNWGKQAHPNHLYSTHFLSIISNREHIGTDWLTDSIQTILSRVFSTSRFQLRPRIDRSRPTNPFTARETWLRSTFWAPQQSKYVFFSVATTPAHWSRSAMRSTT